MQLYLSSYQLGTNPDELASLVLGDKRIGVIRNALDFSMDEPRLIKGREDEFSQLSDIGLVPQEIDLRQYFFENGALESVINELNALWVVGGNTFILRKAMKQSGLDNILIDRVGEGDFVYAGYSAGACVVTPTLAGIHLADEPESNPQGYNREIIWDGLNLVPFCIAPHYRSDHPESEMIEKTVEYFIENKIPFVALHDGEVLVQEVKSLPDNRIQWSNKSPTNS